MATDPYGNNIASAMAQALAGLPSTEHDPWGPDESAPPTGDSRAGFLVPPARRCRGRGAKTTSGVTHDTSPEEVAGISIPD